MFPTVATRDAGSIEARQLPKNAPALLIVRANNRMQISTPSRSNHCVTTITKWDHRPWIHCDCLMMFHTTRSRQPRRCLRPPRLGISSNLRHVSCKMSGRSSLLSRWVVFLASFLWGRAVSVLPSDVVIGCSAEHNVSHWIRRRRSRILAL